MDEGIATLRVLAGKYRLTERLAQGGMGAVWRAEHLQLHVPVAVKLMSPMMLGSEALRARFEREARAAAQLRSRHVVTIHDYGFQGDEPFIVMELLDGEDLSARLRRHKRLTLDQACVIIGQIARALDRAHAAGLVHRDLKPANVFLTRLDDEEIVKVLDFGIAKALGDHGADGLTGDDEVLGTPPYMSPEQIRGLGVVDFRTDLWALAVIAYRMLTGVLPFRGETRGDLVVRVCTEPAQPPSTHERSLGPAVDRFFERAFAKRSEDRFESARALASAFEAALGRNASASASWQRVSVAELPAAPAAEPEGDTTLSVQPTHVLPTLRDLERTRRRGIAVTLAVAAVFFSVVVTIGVSVRRGGQDDVAPALAASPASAPAPPATPEEPPASAAPVAPAPAPVASTVPVASAAAPASTAPAAPSPMPAGRTRTTPNKRRKVDIGL
ncbi:MAG: serine/threonine-protein kinase [Minicystis sp.]